MPCRVIVFIAARRALDLGHLTVETARLEPGTGQGTSELVHRDLAGPLRPWWYHCSTASSANHSVRPPRCTKAYPVALVLAYVLAAYSIELT